MKKYLLLLVGLLLAVESALAVFPQTENVISYYDFNADADDITGSCNGTVVNAVHNTTAYKLGGGSYSFDGSGDHITICGSSLEPADRDWSFAAWFRTTATGTERYILGGSSAGLTDWLNVRQTFGNNMNFIVDDGSNPNTVIDDGQHYGGEWNHIVVTRKASTNNWSLYINGSLIGTNTDTDSGVDLQGNLWIGDWDQAAGSWLGTIDEVGFWNTTLTQTEVSDLWNSGAGEPYPASLNEYEIVITDLYNDSGAANVNITLWNDTTILDSTITDHSGTATFYNAGAGPFNWTANKTGYFNDSGNVSSNVTATGSIYQARYNITTVSAKITSATIANPYNCTTGGNKVYTNCLNVYVLQGSNLLLWQKNNYYSLNTTLSASFNETGVATIVNVTDTRYVFFAVNSFGSPLQNFSITASNLNYSYTETVVAVGSNLTFNLTQGIDYNFSITLTGYVPVNVTLAANASTQNYTFSLSFGNSFNVSIYDENTNMLIDNETFTLLLISDTFANNYTITNGTLIIDLLIPATYEIRYYSASANGNYTIPRSYYTTLLNNSYQNIRLYQIPEAESTFLIPSVIDDAGSPVEGCTLKLFRAQIENNLAVSYVVEMAKTDANGQAVLRIIPNTVYYKIWAFCNADAGNSTGMPYSKITTQEPVLRVIPGSNLLTSFTAITNGAYSLAFNNNTNVITLNWNDDSSIVYQGCLEIGKYDQDGIYTINASSCALGSSGSILYTITDLNQTVYVATSTLYTNTTYSDYGNSLTVSYKSDYQTWGTWGIFLAFLIFLGLTSLGRTSEESIITGVVGIILLGMLGIIAHNYTSFVGILIIAALIAYKARS